MAPYKRWFSWSLEPLTVTTVMGKIPVQYNAIFHGSGNCIFQIKSCGIAPKRDYDSTLEPPH